jgi:hypothetical protein
MTAHDTGHDKRSKHFRIYFGLIPLSMGLLALVMWLMSHDYFYQLSLALQWVLICLSFGIALYLVGALALPWSRPLWLTSNLYDPTHWWGFLLPVSNTLFTAFMATAGFAVVSVFLYRQGLATTSPERALADPFNESFKESLAYYLWSLLDAIPVLELPQTLGWERSFRYTDPASRVLLLVYKVVVILPMIATGVLIWRDIPRLWSGRS